MAKRRTFTPEFKAQVVLEELTGVKDKAEICREYRLSRQLFSRWRAEFVERAPEIFATLVNLGSGLVSISPRLSTASWPFNHCDRSDSRSAAHPLNLAAVCPILTKECGL